MNHLISVVLINPFFWPCCKDLTEGEVTSRSCYYKLLNKQFIYTTSQVMIPSKVLEMVVC